MKRDIVVVAHNIRSCHNIGSLLRTADGLGVKKVYLTGYSPYPLSANDSRLPHLAKKLDKQITKTSLGAEKTVAWEANDNVVQVVEKLKKEGYSIIALEQGVGSIELSSFDPKPKMAVVLGSEVNGVDHDVLELCDDAVYIPMLGSKESFNVVQAAAMTIYRLRYF